MVEATLTGTRLGSFADSAATADWEAYQLGWDARPPVEVPAGADAGLVVQKKQATEELKFVGWRIVDGALVSATSATVVSKGATASNEWPLVAALGDDRFLVYRWIGDPTGLKVYSKAWLVSVGPDATPTIQDSIDLSRPTIFDPYRISLLSFNSDTGVHDALEVPVLAGGFGVQTALPVPTPPAGWGSDSVIGALGLDGAQVLVQRGTSGEFGFYNCSTGAITALPVLPANISDGVGPVLSRGDNGTSYTGSTFAYLDTNFEEGRVVTASPAGFTAEAIGANGRAWEIVPPDGVTVEDWYYYRAIFSGVDARLVHAPNQVTTAPAKTYSSLQEVYDDHPEYYGAYPTFADFQTAVLNAYGTEEAYLNALNAPTTSQQGYLVGIAEGDAPADWGVFYPSPDGVGDADGFWYSNENQRLLAKTSAGWLTYAVEYDGSRRRMAAYLWTPVASGGPQIRWWDGMQVQYATLRGWWDGEAEQPLLVNGWWDGSDVLPVLEGTP